MPKTLCSLGRLLAGTLALAAVSCDKSPSRPSPPTSPTPPVTALAIVAPPSIAPGASAQLTATASRSDGSSEDVTAQALWTSGEPRHVQVTATGLAAAGERGESVVTAGYQGHSAAVRILVLPDGTFRISGRVTDSGFPVPGVAISIVAGTGSGLATATTESGEYVLYGVAGAVRLRAAQHGYFDRIEDLEVTRHRVLDLEMRAAARTNLAGRYVLEIAADGCEAGFPEEARRRTYDAVVGQGGAVLRVHLSGADFVIAGDRGDNFGGLVAPDERVLFAIGAAYYPWYYHYDGPLFDLAERIDSTTTLVVLVVNGTVEARSTASGITGVLTGSIAVTRRMSPPFWPRSATCTSSNHRFDLRRQQP